MKGMKPLDKKSEHVLALLYSRVKHHLDEKSCFPWDENIESFLKENGAEDPYGFLVDLVQMDVLKEPYLGFLQFPGHGVFYSVDSEMEESNMSEGNKKLEESEEESSANVDAVKGTASEAEAPETTQVTETKLTDASEVISTSSDFKLPKIAEFLGDKDEREAVLRSARLVKGKFGTTAILNLEAK